MAMLRFIRRRKFGPVAWLDALAATAVIGLLASQIVIVALRYVFSLGWPWATDLLTYLFFFIVSLPLVRVLLHNESVRVNVLSQSFPRPVMEVIERVALIGLLCPAMTWAAWNTIPMVKTSWRVLEGSPTLGGLPGFFIIKTLAALVFAALAIVSLVMGLRRHPYRKGEKQ
ncbi:TRAP-type mannitol/chloroaromatic compound transport system, small permease component [Salinihabitans flavidus]|uniref:TRAP transporter small permease protein n=1 Tax=Salinihabitans flavidus TaxID=569882 RepID=A0A1H8PA02_9RHOB|nr:TRAP transporter small permease subunit [Salinihabitans flavidus]SEO38760.1 TRAP-type mannitol/chloroaromatic compound transport system, small permease component [Salinihabitans flavidus]